MTLRTFILIPLLAAALHSAAAAQTTPQSISVSQLEQRLTAFTPPAQNNAPLAALKDAQQATAIDNLELSERLTRHTLTAILAQYKFGPQTQQALQLLADRSALLDPPASELPNQPAPNTSQQVQMLGAASTFVFQTLAHLPDFFATRSTARFYGIPPGQNKSGLPVRIGLYPRGVFSREITFRNGKERVDPMQGGEASMPALGFESWGEFGPEPAVILLDLAAGKIAFHHWEQSALGPVAVYRYSVPAAKSRYEVNYSCNGSSSFHAQPGYHGTLAIDPATGAIARLTLQADWKSGDPISHIASVIEYGSVAIGGQTYICPLRSLAFSVVEPDSCTHEMHNIGVVQPMYLNRTTFTDYHRLASTHTIILDPSVTNQVPQK